MDDRTEGPAIRKLRQVRISDADAVPRGVRRWYQLPVRAKRIGNL